MKKIRGLAFLLSILIMLNGCAGGPGHQSPATGTEQQTESTEAPAAETGETEIIPEEEKTKETDMKTEILSENEIRITVGTGSFIVKLDENSSAAALRELLAEGDRTISASNYGGFEKVCALGTTLPSNDVQTTTSAGDVMLYSGNQIVIFYGANSWAYTRLGRVEGLSAEDLKSILSGPETEITLGLK